MYLDYLRLKESLLHQAGFENFVPCTKEEINALERWTGHPFPLAYQEFLQWMGHWGGGVLRGSKCFYDNLEIIQKWARELFRENHCSEMLLKGAFVFLMHHGYHILFFRFDEGNDPPVYSYLENSEKPEETTITQTYLHFSEFLDAIIDESITNSRSRLKLAEEAIKASPGQKISIEELNRNINKQP